jgi:hypothetical protein
VECNWRREVLEKTEDILNKISQQGQHGPTTTEADDDDDDEVFEFQQEYIALAIRSSGLTT